MDGQWELGGGWGWERVAGEGGTGKENLNDMAFMDLTGTGIILI